MKLIGGNVSAIQADASKLEDLDRVADAVRGAEGKVDVVVSNAGFTEQVPLREITEEHRGSVIQLRPQSPRAAPVKPSPHMSQEGAKLLDRGGISALSLIFG